MDSKHVYHLYTYIFVRSNLFTNKSKIYQYRKISDTYRNLTTHETPTFLNFVAFMYARQRQLTAVYSVLHTLKRDGETIDRLASQRQRGRDDVTARLPIGASGKGATKEK